MKWDGKKYQLPDELGPVFRFFRRIFWALQDWWTYLEREDRQVLALLVVAVVGLVILILSNR